MHGHQRLTVSTSMATSLRQVLDCLCLANIQEPWALTGSLGQALQGVALEVNDIDIQTDESGAYSIGTGLSQYAVTPIRWRESDRIRSHLGTFEVDGTQVEVMGGLQKRLPSGEWEPPIDLAQHTVTAEFNGRSVPVLSLAYEATAYELLGRIDRATQLRRHIGASLSSDR